VTASQRDPASGSELISGSGAPMPRDPPGRTSATTLQRTARRVERIASCQRSRTPPVGRTAQVSQTSAAVPGGRQEARD